VKHTWHFLLGQETVKDVQDSHTRFLSVCHEHYDCCSERKLH